jgi:hypothetical protein
MTHRQFRLTPLVFAAGIASSVYAQPSIVSLGLGVSDLSADGNTVAGTFYDAAAPNGYPVCTWTKGVGLRRTTARLQDAQIRCSDDGNAICYGDYNYENYGNLSYGQPGWFARTSITHRWSPASGPVNCGLPANGNRCDFNINTPYDISGNGRYIVGGGWTNGTCGPFRGFRYDTVTGTYNQLPVTVSPPPASQASSAVRANSVSFDGKVVCGYDQNWDPTLSYTTRRAVVWTRNSTDTGWVTTILDGYGGEAYVVSGDGTCVFGQMSQQTMQSTFGTTSRNAVRWKKTGSTWVPINLGPAAGYPSASSSDGNTAIGDNFFWRASYNGGVAVNLTSYFESLGGVMGGLEISAPNGVAPVALSADGNVAAVRTTDRRDPCLSVFGSALLYFNGTACEPPRLNLSPVSDTNVVYSPGYYYYGVILNAFASGSWPLNFQWQKFDAGTGAWVNLVDDEFCSASYQGPSFDVKASHTPQLRIGFLSGTWQGSYRCVVSNSCGTITTDVAEVSAPFCAADYNGDGGVDGADVEAFFGDWQSGESRADVNLDGGVDGADIETFFTLWTAGGC